MPWARVILMNCHSHATNSLPISPVVNEKFQLTFFLASSIAAKMAFSLSFLRKPCKKIETQRH